MEVRHETLEEDLSIVFNDVTTWSNLNYTSKVKYQNSDARASDIATLKRFQMVTQTSLLNGSKTDNSLKEAGLYGDQL